jgi:hypothetical protein
VFESDACEKLTSQALIVCTHSVEKHTFIFPSLQIEAGEKMAEIDDGSTIRNFFPFRSQ